jgi:diguanylate cyclase (GGDEF)-like protein
MRKPAHPYVEDFRDTPFGRQLHEGFRLLRFRAPLEGDFRGYLDRHARLSQQLAALLLILVVSSYLYVEWRYLPIGKSGWIGELTLLRLLQLVPGVVVLALSFFNRWVRAQADRLFPLLLVLIGAIASRIDIQYERIGLDIAFRYGAGLLIIASFFFLGITFWRALLCATAMIVIDVLLALLLLAPEQLPEHWLAVSYYGVLLIIGAVSRYAHEYSQREQFLVRKLLGWVAEHDALSGLGNRRSHDATLARLAGQAHREQTPLAMLLLDIDDFKPYNDRLGHPAGDALIRICGELLQSFARRPLDHVARVGGEEFAVLLYDCDADSARRIAEQILAAFAARNIAHPQSASGRVGVSIGLAMLQPEQTAEQLYHDADAALYRAKQAGKNRIDVAVAPAAG